MKKYKFKKEDIGLTITCPVYRDLFGHNFYLIFESHWRITPIRDKDRRAVVRSVRDREDFIKKMYGGRLPMSVLSYGVFRDYFTRDMTSPLYWAGSFLCYYYAGLIVFPMVMILKKPKEIYVGTKEWTEQTGQTGRPGHYGVDENEETGQAQSQAQAQAGHAFVVADGIIYDFLNDFLYHMDFDYTGHKKNEIGDYLCELFK